MPPSEKLGRSGSTAVFSVSEFYGPQGARMLQRRGSTASALSFAESYGDTEPDGAGSRRDEQQDGQDALSMMLRDSERGQDATLTAAMNAHLNAKMNGIALPEQQHAMRTRERQRSCSPSTTVTRSVTASLTAASASAVLERAVGAHDAVNLSQDRNGAFVDGKTRGDIAGELRCPARASMTQAKGFTPMEVDRVSVDAPGTVPMAVCGVSSGSNGMVPASTVNGTCKSSPCPSRSPLASGPNGPLIPPPLILEAPHPAATGVISPNILSTRDGSASSGLLPWASPPGGEAAGEVTLGGTSDDGRCEANNKRENHLRAMSVDSAPAPPTEATSIIRSRTASMGALPETHATCPTTNFVQAQGASLCVGVTIETSASTFAGGAGVADTGGIGAHSPRLRAKSTDSKRKGKSKRGKGSGTAVMGKADRIGRMLQVNDIR